MIVVIVKQPVRAKYADEWPSLVEEFTTSTRAEPGNISFDWYRSAEDPNLWILIEVFRDRASGTPTFSPITSRRPRDDAPLLAAAPEIINVEVPGDSWSQMS